MIPQYVQDLHNALYFAHFWGTPYAMPLKNVEQMFQKFTTTNHWRLIEMATKKAAASVDTPKFESVKWVNRNLSESEKQDHDEKKPKPADLFKDMLGLCNQGYNLSVKWDSYSKCFQAALLPYSPQCPNAGYGLSARAVTPERAVSLLLYKHFVVLEENWVAHYQAPLSSFEG